MLRGLRFKSHFCMYISLLHGSEKRQEKDQLDVAKCQYFVNLNELIMWFVVLFLQLFCMFKTSRLIFGKKFINTDSVLFH